MEQIKVHRLLLMVSGIMYPIFGYVNLYVLPHHFESLSTLIQRILIGGLMWLSVGLSIKFKEIATHYYYVITGFIYLGSIHLIYIAFVFGWELNHTVGVIMVLMLTSMVFRKTSHLLMFLITFLLLAFLSIYFGYHPAISGNHPPIITTIESKILYFLLPTICAVVYLLINYQIKAQAQIMALNHKAQELNMLMQKKQIELTNQNLKLIESNLESEIHSVKYNAIYNLSAFGMYILDTDEIIIDTNTRFEHITNYQLLQLKGKKIDSIALAEDKPTMASAWKAYLENNTSYDVEFRVQTPMGIKWLRNIITPINFRQQKEGYVGVLIDTTESKRIEQAHTEEQTKNKIFKQFETDFRAPLNSIVGSANLLINSASLTLKQQEILWSIEANITNALSLMDNVFDYNLFLENEFFLKQDIVPLTELIQEELRLLQRIASDKGVQLVIEVDPNLSRYYLCDANQLLKVLYNLTRKVLSDVLGNVHLKIVLGKSDLSDDHVSFCIEGIGGKSSPKFLMDSSISHDQFGIQVAEKIVLALGSAIEKREDQSTGVSYEFVLSLPRAIKSEPQLQKNAGPVFLLVEDNEFNQIVLRDTLLDWNPSCQIHWAENGKIALNMLAKMDVDLIFMDIRMPIMDGHEATKAIRTQFPTPKSKVPIIAITAHALKTEEAYCLANGFDAYLTKPFDANVLIKCAEKFLAHTETKVFHNNEKVEMVHISGLIDYDMLLKTTKGIPERIQKMVNMFMADTPIELVNLQKFFDEKNTRQLGALAHSLKPKYLFLGMPELSNLAKIIEQQAADEKLDEATQINIAQLKEWTQQCISQLQHYMDVNYSQ